MPPSYFTQWLLGMDEKLGADATANFVRRWARAVQEQTLMDIRPQEKEVFFAIIEKESAERNAPYENAIKQRKNCKKAGWLATLGLSGTLGVMGAHRAMQAEKPYEEGSQAAAVAAQLERYATQTSDPEKRQILSNASHIMHRESSDRLLDSTLQLGLGVLMIAGAGAVVLAGALRFDDTEEKMALNEIKVSRVHEQHSMLRHTLRQLNKEMEPELTRYAAGLKESLAPIRFR